MLIYRVRAFLPGTVSAVCVLSCTSYSTYEGGTVIKLNSSIRGAFSMCIFLYIMYRSTGRNTITSDTQACAAEVVSTVLSIILDKTSAVY